MGDPVMIGIDPGLDGAVAMLRPRKAPVVFGTPTSKYRVAGRERRAYDLPAMAAIFAPLHPQSYNRLPILAAVEVTNARPGQSAISTASQFRGIGLWQGILAGLGIPQVEVRPQVWKRAVGLPKGADKRASLVLARTLHPALHDQLARQKDEGRAEALLIAEWCRREWGKEPWTA